MIFWRENRNIEIKLVSVAGIYSDLREQRQHITNSADTILTLILNMA